MLFSLFFSIEVQSWDVMPNVIAAARSDPQIEAWLDGLIRWDGVDKDPSSTNIVKCVPPLGFDARQKILNEIRLELNNKRMVDIEINSEGGRGPMTKYESAEASGSLVYLGKTEKAAIKGKYVHFGIRLEELPVRSQAAVLVAWLLDDGDHRVQLKRCSKCDEFVWRRNKTRPFEICDSCGSEDPPKQNE